MNFAAKGWNEMDKSIIKTSCLSSVKRALSSFILYYFNIIVFITIIALYLL